LSGGAVPYDVLQRPDFHNAMRNCARGSRNDLDRFGEIGRFNQREACDRQGRRHEGGVLRLDPSRERIADLSRRARGANQRSALFHPGVVGVGRIANLFGRAVVASAVAISNRNELRHVEFFLH
jgi:hypothetical protein